MCGIVGYVGDRDTAGVLLKGLKKLEYRGYDSAGIALNGQDEISVVKAKGRLCVLEQKLESSPLRASCCGIGHTRWATHGEPSDENSHPHLSESGRIAVVHNGIIENYQALKAALLAKGYQFHSQTDTEVITQLFDYYYNGNLRETAVKVLSRVEGSYALGVLCRDNPDEVLAVRKDSPLIVGLGKGENFIASDIPALLEYTRDYYLLEDNEIACITKDNVRIYNLDGDELHKAQFHVDWDIQAAEKGGFEHFMLKEIHEQPKALRDTLLPHIRSGEVVFDELSLTDEQICSIDRIHIVGCGSAWHAGMVGKNLFEQMCRIPTEVELASEFRYRDPILGPNDLCVVISQSGETADTLAALREAKRRGVRVLSIVNVVGSSIARESHDVLYTRAGPEIAVATTKAYSAQLAVLDLLALYIAKRRGQMKQADYSNYVLALAKLPEQVETLIQSQSNVQYLASRFVGAKDVFFIGRGMDYAVALEGSLKLKEVSYIHSEAYAAGELKHGTISLIEPGTLVVALATQEGLLFEKMISNIVEVRSRGAVVLALARETGSDAASMQVSGRVTETAEHVINIPVCPGAFTPSLNVIPLQLFAYYLAVERGCDVDKPRNLAKSVTVE